MIFVMAFLVGGLICMIGQLILDIFKLLPIHLTSLFVFLGALLDSFHLYDRLIEVAGAGATIPITSFGHALTHAALQKASESGVIGLASGIFSLTAVGIAAAIIFSFFTALIFKPRG